MDHDVLEPRRWQGDLDRGAHGVVYPEVCTGRIAVPGVERTKVLARPEVDRRAAGQRRRHRRALSVRTGGFERWVGKVEVPVMQQRRRRAWAGVKLDRHGPVAPAAGSVLMTHAHAIRPVRTGDAVGDRDLARRTGQRAGSPKGLDFVSARADFGHAPFRGGVGVRPLRIGKGRGGEDQFVHGITFAAGVGQRRPMRDLGIGGLGLEILVTVAELVAVVHGPSATGPGIGGVVEQISHEILVRGVAAERRSAQPAVPAAADAAVGEGGPEEIAAMVRLPTACADAAPRARVQVPHCCVGVRPGDARAVGMDAIGELADELADLAAGRRGVGGQQIENLAAAVAESQRQGRMLEQCLVRVDDTRVADAVDRGGPMGLGNEHHVLVPRDHHPPVVGWAMVKEMVGAAAEVDVADEPVEGVEGVVVWQIEIRLPPGLGGIG